MKEDIGLRWEQALKSGRHEFGYCANHQGQLEGTMKETHRIWAAVVVMCFFFVFLGAVFVFAPDGAFTPTKYRDSASLPASQTNAPGTECGRAFQDAFFVHGAPDVIAQNSTAAVWQERWMYKERRMVVFTYENGKCSWHLFVFVSPSGGFRPGPVQPDSAGSF